MLWKVSQKICLSVSTLSCQALYFYLTITWQLFYSLTFFVFSFIWHDKQPDKYYWRWTFIILSSRNLYKLIHRCLQFLCWCLLLYFCLLFMLAFVCTIICTHVVLRHYFVFVASSFNVKQAGIQIFGFRSNVFNQRLKPILLTFVEHFV